MSSPVFRAFASPTSLLRQPPKPPRKPEDKRPRIDPRRQLRGLLRSHTFPRVASREGRGVWSCAWAAGAMPRSSPLPSSTRPDSLPRAHAMRVNCNKRPNGTNTNATTPFSSSDMKNLVCLEASQHPPPSAPPACQDSPRVVSKSHHRPRTNSPPPSHSPAPPHPPKYCLNPLPQLSCKLERIEHGDKSSHERRRGDSSLLQTRFSLSFLAVSHCTAPGPPACNSGLVPLISACSRLRTGLGNEQSRNKSVPDCDPTNIRLSFERRAAYPTPLPVI